MPGVFISYRREDSGGYTGRLFDILSAEFGPKNTYMDVDTIKGGDDFASVINQKISVSDVLVAVIGDRWLTAKEESGTRRLDNPHDFVHIEIAEALQRGIRVIPVLVAGATMPLALDLPEDLRALCERQAVEIRDSHFHQDAEQLTHVLHSSLHGAGFRGEKLNAKRLVLALLVGAAAIAGTAILLLYERRGPAPPMSNAARHDAIPPTAGPATAIDVPRAAGDSARKQFTPGIAGKWSATVKYDWGDTYKEVFDFEADGQELSGTAGLLGAARSIREGKIIGDRISFLTKTITMLGADQYEDTHSYKGTIESGGIRFTMVTDSRASEHTPVHFVATRVKDR
jgi:TIR domain-containing protein